MKIVIIDYGAGNIQSVLFSLERLGYKGIVSNCSDEIISADKIIFPGVGEAGSAMKQLKLSGLDGLIPTLKQPVLGICLGMQLMCRYSEESNTECLGIFDTNIIRFTNNVKVPQVGWNTIYNLKSELFKGITEETYMYLVHSYFAPKSKQSIAKAFYDVVYDVALQKENFYGVQFHPEKSGSHGEQILRNFLEL
ncbi:imidazole glycerol phosphate synthase subunit HisH [Flavobacterium enshiense]|uniref:imidazole glycerol phosphate synthase subunit HisH n=1 Tax=Flavobacterium enshiense TaxID=1341165 RepID=UPI00345DE558